MRGSRSQPESVAVAEPKSDARPVDRLLTAREVAARLAISETAVYSLCAAGELPHHKIGVGTKRRRYRFSQADVDAYLAASRVDRPATISLPERPARKVTKGRVVEKPLEFMRSIGWKG